MIDYVDYKNCVRNSWIFSGVIFYSKLTGSGIECRDSNYRVHMSNGNTFQNSAHQNSASTRIN